MLVIPSRAGARARAWEGKGIQVLSAWRSWRWSNGCAPLATACQVFSPGSPSLTRLRRVRRGWQ